MPFVKVDSGLLDSTLWKDKDGLRVFMTALLMAEPGEIEIPQRSLSPDTMDVLDFIVPPGWYGFVKASGPGIITRALLDQDDGMLALHRLCSPDPQSRTSDFNGRRMARVNGGFVILNFMKHRDRDHTAAERMRRLRDRKKRKSVANSTREALPNWKETDPLRCNVTSRDVTVTHSREQRAEAEAESHMSESGPGQGRFIHQISCPACTQVGYLVRSKPIHNVQPTWWCRSLAGGCGFTFPIDYPEIIEQLSPGGRRAALAINADAQKSTIESPAEARRRKAHEAVDEAFSDEPV